MPLGQNQDSNNLFSVRIDLSLSSLLHNSNIIDLLALH